MIKLRPYQTEAMNAIYKYWAEGGGNPLVDMATGLGKSVVIAELARFALEVWPEMRILMLVHVRELVRQNYQEMRSLWPEAPIGIYSAGLNQRDGQAQIVYASIQSVYKRADLLGRRDLVIIDEAHLVPHDGSGMYKTLLSDLRAVYPEMRIVGFTATPYRLDSGRLDKGDDRLFDDVVYSYGIGQGIEDFYLAPLVSRAGKVEIDTSTVGKRGGEFIAAELEAVALNDGVIGKAVSEIIQRGQDRKSWLVFCTGIKHSEKVAEALRQSGITAVAVHSKMPQHERDEAIESFKTGQIQCLTNAQVLTTGFNAPGVDLIAFLRPTLSTGLYVQMMGRGTRNADGKSDCLVLDFSGNVRRHGPVDAVNVNVQKKHKSGEKEHKVNEDDIRAKECPKCQALVAVSEYTCKYCGHEFPGAPAPKHNAKPDTNVTLLTRELPKGPAGSVCVPVYGWNSYYHEKRTDPTAPPTVCVSYRAGVSYYKEWLCASHPAGSYPRQKFFAWWQDHGGALPAPASVNETLKRWDEVQPPEKIHVKQDGQFWKIVGRVARGQQ